MAFICSDVLAGAPDLYTVDTLGPGPLVGLATGPTSRGFTNYPGLEIRGFDPFLGGGAFVFARASGTIAASTVCEMGINTTATNRYDVNMTAWAGTANSGKSLAVAMTALTVGQFGWFQVEGNAVTSVSGAPAVGNPVYWQAAGVVSPTAVASKQAVNAVFTSAAGATVGSGSAAVVLAAGQAVVLLNRPAAQGAIT